MKGGKIFYVKEGDWEVSIYSIMPITPVYRWCTCIVLTGVNLRGAVLEGSMLAGVNLRVATLKNANLKNCDLRGAVLAGADLEVSKH